jgi:hypothetical protein
MSIKFSIPTIAFATLLTLAYSSIASAETYKTSKDQVVVTGLTAKQKYPISGINSKNKPVKRQDVVANGCGEALVDGAAKYKSVTIGTETAVDPATLPTKVHATCKPKKTASTAPRKSPAATGSMMPTTTTPATTTPATKTPATVPSVAPITK